MATVSISLYQKRESIEGGYRVTNEITAAAGVEIQLFTIKFVDGSGPQWLGGNDIYQHVSTVSDLKNYPAVSSFPFAPSTSTDYYRYHKVVLDYDSLAGAIDQATVTKTRMQELATEWQTVVDSFEGTEDYAYQSADGQVSFTLEQAQTQVAPDDYQVTSTIKPSPAPVGIEHELFLYDPKGPTPPDPPSDTFVRVCTVDDLGSWPTDSTWSGEQYYRSATAPVDFVLLQDALDHAETVRTDLEVLAQDYDTATDDFEGEETTVYTA